MPAEKGIPASDSCVKHLDEVQTSGGDGCFNLLQIFEKLIDGGTYQDFLNFVSVTSGHEFEYLADIAQALLARCKTVTLPIDAIDICGTGGDAPNIKTTNISTISAFVLAAMGVPVAKHGGRAVSSSSGSIDFLEALGILEIDPVVSIQKYGLCFLRAQNHHEAFRGVASFRKEYGKKTIFNLLGPLINPANISHQMVGVSFANENMEKYAEVLHKLGRKNIAVVQAEGSFDELLSFKKNTIVFMKNGEAFREELDGSQFGFLPFNFKDSSDAIIGKTPQENAENALKFFENPKKSVLCDTIALNCAVAATVFGRASNVADGVELAREAIFSKKSFELLQNMIYGA